MKKLLLVLTFGLFIGWTYAMEVTPNLLYALALQVLTEWEISADELVTVFKGCEKKNKKLWKQCGEVVKLFEAEKEVKEIKEEKEEKSEEEIRAEIKEEVKQEMKDNLKEEIKEEVKAEIKAEEEAEAERIRLEEEAERQRIAEEQKKVIDECMKRQANSQPSFRNRTAAPTGYFPCVMFW